MSKDKKLKPETEIIESGYSPLDAFMSAKPPLYLTSTFVFKSAEAGEEFFAALHDPGKRAAIGKEGLIYSRLDNPNLRIFESRLKVFDGADAALGFSSGMSAIATSILATAREDSYLAYASPVYGGTEVLFEEMMPRMGVDVRAVRAGDNAPAAFADLVEKNGPPFMFFLETPANPSIEMSDIGSVSELARSLNIDGGRPLVAVDNTFLGPIFQQPLKHGADLVIYSCTKFIGGHSDLVAGATLGSEKLIRQIRRWRSIIGTTISPFTAWLSTRSLETLDLRMRRSAETAAKIARALDEHPAVREVFYPELFPAGSKQRAIYEKQCSGPGGLISFELDSKQAAFSFLNALKVFTLAVSLGGNESLAEHPAAMTHADIPLEVRQKIGVSEELARLSVGLEHPDDLLEDVLQALEKSSQS